MAKASRRLTLDATTLERISGPHTISLELAGLTLISTVLSQALFERSRVGGPIGSWLLLSVAAHAVAWTYLIIVTIGYRWRYRKYPPTALMYFLYLSAAVIAGYVISTLIVDFGLATDPQYAKRMTTTGLVLGTYFAGNSIGLSIIQDRSRTLAQYFDTRVELLKVRNSAASIVEQARGEVEGIIDNEIEPVLEQLRTGFNRYDALELETLDNLQQRITDFIENTVRPLTRALSATPTFIASPSSNPIRMQWRMAQWFPRDVPPAAVISPLTWFLLLILPISADLTKSIGYDALGAALIVSLPSALILWLFRQALDYVRPESALLAWTMVFFSYLATWMPTLYVVHQTVTMISGQDVHLEFGATTATALIGGMSFSYIYSVDYQRERLATELEATNELLRAENADIQQQIWYFRSSYAQLLHGTVQSTLTAAKLRIAAVAAGDTTAAVAVRHDFERAISALSNTQPVSIDVNKSLEDMAAMWAGICEVNLRLDSRALKLLSDSPVSAKCVHDVAQECISNSIRHGNAKWVHIALDVVAPHRVRLGIADDGLITKPTTRGIGSDLLDTVTTRWSRTAQQTGYLVSAEFDIN